MPSRLPWGCRTLLGLLNPVKGYTITWDQQLGHVAAATTSQLENESFANCIATFMVWSSFPPQTTKQQLAFLHCRNTTSVGLSTWHPMTVGCASGPELS